MKFKILWISLIYVSCQSSNNEPQFSLLWEYVYTQSTESLSLVITPPTILDQEYLLIAPDFQISIISRRDGKLQRTIPLFGESYMAQNEPLIESTSLFLKEHKNNTLGRINLNTGLIMWEVEAPEELFHWSNDAFDNEFIYLSSNYAKIFKYSKDGNFINEYNLMNYGIKTDARSIRVLNNQLIFSQYFRNEGSTIDSGRILSIDKETEEVLWEYRTDKGGYIFEPILLEEGIIYAGVTDGPGEFVALDATNGEVIWQAPGVVSHAYTLTDSMVLVQGGITLRALDKFTGEELWNTGLKFGGGHGQENIAYLNGYVYHIHSGSMWILEANTGEIVHREGISGYLITAGDDKIFVQGDYSLRAYTAWK
jgi:outer membrane protein assembly factor BamB